MQQQELHALTSWNKLVGMQGAFIAYYGVQGDVNDHVHAQLIVLAGLHEVQLARVKESISWITIALQP